MSKLQLKTPFYCYNFQRMRRINYFVGTHDMTRHLFRNTDLCNNCTIHNLLKIQSYQVLDSFRGVSLENGSLNGCSIGNSFVGIDGLVQFFAIEKVLKNLQPYSYFVLIHLFMFNLIVVILKTNQHSKLVCASTQNCR